VNETIYQHPADYDLEHEGDDRDVRFYRRLMTRLRPTAVLEFACGSARITLPLAAELRAHDGHVVGVEVNEQMLDQARSKLAEGDPGVSTRVRLAQGDMRRWRTSERFDVVLIACSSITHLLTLEDFASHIYFPRELTLLYLHAGFSIETVWADYTFRAASSQAREIVMVGVKSQAAEKRSMM
jgi:predicted O-methyltransferase YrrM